MLWAFMLMCAHAGARKLFEVFVYVRVCNGMLFKSLHVGLVVPPVSLFGASDACGITFEKCYDWAKENNRRTSRVKHPML